jgi:Right handed beta helix region
MLDVVNEERTRAIGMLMSGAALVLSGAALVVAAIVAATFAQSSRPVKSDVSGLFGPISVSCFDNTSDAATLQYAINSSPPGSTILISGGICLLTKGIELPGNRTYEGESKSGTVLKQDSAMGYVLASQAYVEGSSTTGPPLAISNLSVECNRSGKTDGIIIMNWQVDVSRVDVNNCGGSGILDTNTAANGKAISGTSVNSRFNNNFISNSGKFGFAEYDSGDSVTDGFLVDNQIASSGQDAIHLDDSAGWQISGNHLYDDYGNGIYVNRLYGSIISNNYIEDFGYKKTTGNWFGIIGTVQGGSGSNIFSNMLYNVKGEVGNSKHVYVGIMGTNYGTGYLSATGNVVIGDKTSDIGFFFDGGYHRLVVASTGNEIAGVGTATSYAHGALKAVTR